MKPKLKKWRRKLLIVATGGFVILAAAILIYFPGRQTPIALTLATGIGVGSLQAKVDALEEKAVRGDPFTTQDKLLLHNLYSCFAKGGRLTIVLRQSAELMDRYLSCRGEDLLLNPRIFLGSKPVQLQMSQLRDELLANSQSNVLREIYRTADFYMGDPDFFESFVGLYIGNLSVRPKKMPDGSLLLSWRAEVPWKWPSYSSLTEKGGNPHTQSFPIPNARSLLQGRRYCLYMDDGLGQHLEMLGLAKPFLAYSEWEELVRPTPNAQ